MTENKQFATGAQRSKDADGLDFISIHPIALIALARVCAEGAEKYGAHNYERGMPATDALNHVLRHITLYLAGDRSDPHLEHALWGAHTAVVMATLHPELDEARRRGPGCTVTPAMNAALEAGAPERRRKKWAGEFENLADWKLADVPEVAKILDERFAASLELDDDEDDDDYSAAVYDE